MKKAKLISMAALIVAMALASLVGCSPKAAPPEVPPVTEPVDGPFTPSFGLTADGLWIGVNARDHVVLPVYRGMLVPKSVHEIPDSAVEAEIGTMLAKYATEKTVTDRAIRDGDTVNIDFVGTVGGKEFTGGSTGGQGTTVTIGVTSYIDGFLEQLIGRRPGQSFNIKVTFPSDYGNAEVDGKEAVFAITVNHIVETELPEITDAFVMEKFGHTSHAGLTAALRKHMSQQAVGLHVQQRLVDETEVKSIPRLLIEYQEKSLIDFYEVYASGYSMPFVDFLNQYIGVDSIDALLEMHREENESTARLYLILQAVAEDARLVVEEVDIVDYFLRYVGKSDYSEFETQYGMPYIKVTVLQQMVIDFVVKHATLE